MNTIEVTNPPRRRLMFVPLGASAVSVKPTQNGFIESFNGRLGDECLDEHLFSSLPEARRIIETWTIDYNTKRPHTSLNGLTPTEFAARPNQGHNQNRLSL